MAEYLLKQGQLELVIETARDRGEWFQDRQGPLELPGG